MKFLVYILIVFSFLSHSLNAQEKFEFNQCRDSFLKYEFLDTTIASQYLKKMGDVVFKSKSKKNLAIYYLSLGWFAQDRSDFSTSLNYFKKMLSISKKYKLLQQEADAYGNMANLYEDLSDNVNSMKYLQLSLQINEKILRTAKDSTEIYDAMSGKSAAYGNLGNAYKTLNDYDKAIEMMTESLALDSALGNLDYLATSFSNLAGIYHEIGDDKIAIDMINKCIKTIEKGKKNKLYVKIELLYHAYQIKGNLFKDLNKLDSALFYMNKANELAIKFDDKHYLSLLMSSYGKIYQLQGNHQKAITLFKQGLDFAYEIKSNERIHHLAKNLSNAYKLVGNEKEAYRYLIIADQYRDSLMNAEKMRELGRAEVNYQFKFKSSLDSLNYKKSLEEKEKIRKAENEKHEAEAAKRNIFLIGLGIILVIVSIFSIYLIRLYKGKKRAHEIIIEQKKVTDHHLEIIAEKQKEIVDSINYAKRIQYALLAHREVMENYLPEHFVLFRPKDIVSGDFYWFTHYKDGNNQFSFLAVCDSTGHGVPGAFMSLLNISFINEAITEKNILEPNLVFNHVRNRLVENLGKEGQNDGFDGILLRVDHSNGKMVYASSNNPPVLINETEALVLACDKMPVGKGEISNSFELFEIPSDKKGILYLTTDGYSDQFGGEKGKKLKFANMLKYFKEIHSLPIYNQEALLNKKFDNWKGDLEQLDDVCIIGVSII